MNGRVRNCFRIRTNNSRVCIVRVRIRLFVSSIVLKRPCNILDRLIRNISVVIAIRRIISIVSRIVIRMQGDRRDNFSCQYSM